MKRKVLVVFLSLSIAVLSCGLIYGMVSVEVTNEFETGIVDIRIEEYQRRNEKETLWEDNPVILPGDTVSKIPRIFNDGNDCYVRAKITFQGITELDESNLLGISDKWVKADDGYYYYTKILPHGEDVDIFEALYIPDDFSQANEEKQFSIDIDADAIQSINFEPEFSMAQPWGSVEILDCGKEGQYDVSTFKKTDNQNFSVTYQGDVNKLVKNRDNFFVNFPYLMPGDTYNDTLDLVNNSKKDIKIYFRSKATDTSALLDKIQLKITTVIDGKTKVFYSGDLRAEKLNEDIVLGVIPKNKEGSFHFEVHVPPELNNQYTISSSLVKWIFSTEPIPDDPFDSPKTGDDSHVMLWGTITIVSLIGLVWVSILMIKDKKEREKGTRYAKRK